jgi:hypothetical protein
MGGIDNASRADRPSESDGTLDHGDASQADAPPADRVAIDPSLVDATPDAPSADAAAVTATGQACTAAADCGAGYECLTEAPDGYCVAGAPGGPAACRDPDAPCTLPGTVCSPLPEHQISGVCLQACQASTDCRPGYVCNLVQLFPGDPSSPQSPAKVCWTACVPGQDMTCNDDPSVSSLRGTCQSDGTCICSSGAMLNPGTGRCY